MSADSLSLRLFFSLAAVLAGCSSGPLPRVSPLVEKPAVVSASTETSCGDFLRRFQAGPVPIQLEFIKCSEGQGGQVVRTAEYRVRGDRADVVEAFLRKTYSMNELQFVCCGWEPKSGKNGHFEVGDHYFLVSMHSEETLVDDRTRWGEIPFFSVTVEFVEV